MAESALLGDELLVVIRDLSFARDMESVAAVIRKAARRLTGADGITFVLKDNGYCYYADEDAIGPLWKGRRFPLTACISGWVMLNRQPAAISDIYEDPRIPHDAYRPTFVQSLLMVPVRQEDPIAAIGAYWARRHQPTPAEQLTAQHLADAAALALANVQLYSDLQAAVAREREARKLAEEASRLKDEFLSTLSHELRTPLNIIQGWLWQLERREFTREQLVAAVSAASRNAGVQIRMVEDLLDAAYGFTGKLRIRPERVSLTETCRRAVEVAQPGAQARGIALSVFLPDEGVDVWADPDRLHQVMWNLLQNAVKFTPDGGRVEVEVRRNGTRAHLLVRDTGIGITPEFLPFVFDRFRQADGGTTRRYGGLGLGLTIVQQLVQLHGGQVRIESDGEGKGTTATVEWPLRAVEGSAHPLVAGSAGASR